MKTSVAWVAGAALLAQCPLGCSSSSSSAREPAPPSQVRGIYGTTSEGAIRQIQFYDATHYSLWRSPCAEGERPAPEADGCREEGSYALNADRSELSLTNASTGRTTAMPFHALALDASAAGQSAAGEVQLESLVGGDGNLVQNNGALISSFQAGSQNFQGGCDLGAEMAKLAHANEGNGPCKNSKGGGAFGTSCTGSGGSPEFWCADFVKWIWSEFGVDVGKLDAGAVSFYKYGNARGTFSQTPHVGDAVVFNYSPTGGYLNGPRADHVAIVTDVKGDQIATVSGDWGGHGGTDVEVASSAHVVDNGYYSSQVGGAVQAMGGYHISGYISPVGGSCPK